jgi:hypothetical protein
MKLGILFKRTIYRELRSSVGYYDARRIIRSIEKNAQKVKDMEEFMKTLSATGFDERHVRLTTETVRKYSPLLKKEDSTSIDRPTFDNLTAPVSAISEKDRGLTWLNGNHSARSTRSKIAE